MVASLDVKATEEIKSMNLACEDLMVASLDVKALYPSLDIPVVAKMAAKMVANSKLRLGGIDYHWATVYLALSLSKEEVKKRK